MKELLKKIEALPAGEFVEVMQSEGWWSLHEPITTRELKELAAEILRPIDMLLYCPNCGLQHVDAPEPDKCECGCPRDHHARGYGDIRAHCLDCSCIGFLVAWLNPPHKSHLCHGCGTVWRPADVPTNGVAEIKTRGENDSWVPEDCPTAKTNV